MGEKFSAAYITDGQHPSIVGVFLVGVSSSAICSALYFGFTFWCYCRKSDEERAFAEFPIVPVDILVLGVIALVWISLWAMADQIFSTKTPPPKRQHGETD